MKKIAYMTPDMEVLDLKLNYNVLQAGSPADTSGSDPGDHGQIDDDDEFLP